MLEEWFSAAFSQRDRPSATADCMHALAFGNEFKWDAGKDPILRWYEEFQSKCKTPGSVTSSNSLHMDIGNCSNGAASVPNEYFISTHRETRCQYMNSVMKEDIRDGRIFGCSSPEMCSTCLTEVDHMWSSAWDALKCGHQATPSSTMNLSSLLTFVVCTWNAAGLFCSR